MDECNKIKKTDLNPSFLFNRLFSIMQALVAKTKVHGKYV